jgi:tetratricopeptide (TPR) repeat protein
MALDRAKTAQAAERLLKAGKIPEAITEFKKLAEDNPRDMNIANKLGDLFLRAGKNQDAIRYFLRIAEFYAGDGFFLKAIAMYKKISKLDPANMDCLEKLAGLYQQQGLTIEAKAQFLQVAEHFLKAGQLKKAIEVYPKVLEVEPDNLKVRLTYAELLVRASSPKEAAREYRSAAQDLARKGMLDEAIRVAQKGTKIAPGDPDMMSLMLSLSKEADKSPGELLATVVQMAKSNGDNPRSQALLGEAYLAAGKTADAEKVFARLQGMEDPLPPEAAAAIARFYVSRDDADAGFEWAGRAADAYGETQRGRDALALVDEVLRAFPEHQSGLASKAALAEAAGDKAAQVEALRQLAQVMKGTGEIEPAREILQKLQQLDAENPRYANLLRELDEAPAGGVAPARAAPKSRPAAAAARAPAPAARAVPDIQEGALELDEEPEFIDEIESVAPLLGTSDALGDLEDEEDYGPNSKIQEIQAAPDEEEEEPEDDEFVSEHFTEAEVFVKYGLLEKAKEQLLKILGRYPKHVQSHSKLKEIYYDEGDKEDAVEECLTLADIMKSRNRGEESQDFVNEAIRIDPNNPRLKAYAGGAETAPPAAAPKAAAAAQAKSGAPAKAAAAAPKPAMPSVPAAGPSPPSAKAARPASAPPPELEIVEEETAESVLEIETEEAAPADALEIELEAAEEKPAPARPAPPAKASTPAARPVPEKIEEETPEDFLSGVPDDAGDEITIEIADDAGGESAAPQAAALAGASRDPDPEKLGEVDFYIDQGLLEEARAVLFQLQKQHPGSQEVSKRFERANRPSAPEAVKPAPKPVESPGLDLDVERAFGSQTVSIPSASAAKAAPRASKPKPVFRVAAAEPEPEGDFFDLASELDKSLAEAQVAVDTHEDAIEGSEHSLDEIFKAFRKGVEQQVDSQDYETHYNLGIAYKEMGLIDEAIAEFQHAAKDASRTVECCGILGLCFRDKGMPLLALKWYQKAIETPDLPEEQALGLRYDIAEVYREQGDQKKALQLYTEVYGIDSSYRDVAARIKELKKRA